MAKLYGEPEQLDPEGIMSVAELRCAQTEYWTGLPCDLVHERAVDAASPLYTLMMESYALTGSVIVVGFLVLIGGWALIADHVG